MKEEQKRRTIFQQANAAGAPRTKIGQPSFKPYYGKNSYAIESPDRNMRVKTSGMIEEQAKDLQLTVCRGMMQLKIIFADLKGFPIEILTKYDISICWVIHGLSLEHQVNLNYTYQGLTELHHRKTLNPSLGSQVLDLHQRIICSQLLWFENL